MSPLGNGKNRQPTLSQAGFKRKLDLDDASPVTPRLGTSMGKASPQLVSSDNEDAGELDATQAKVGDMNMAGDLPAKKAKATIDDMPAKQATINADDKRDEHEAGVMAKQLSYLINNDVKHVSALGFHALNHTCDFSTREAHAPSAPATCESMQASVGDSIQEQLEKFVHERVGDKAASETSGVQLKADLGKRSRNFAEQLLVASQGAPVAANDPLAQKMNRELSSQDKVKMKGMARADKQEFRKQWALKQLSLYTETKSYEERWRTCDISRGRYMSASKVFEAEGGGASKQAGHYETS